MFYKGMIGADQCIPLGWGDGVEAGSEMDLQSYPWRRRHHQAPNNSEQPASKPPLGEGAGAEVLEEQPESGVTFI